MKKIIVDCDGVLLDWAYAFDVWMGEHGYKRIPDTDKYYSQSFRYGITDDESYRQIKKFNESGCVGFIPAFRDSVEYVTKLSRMGWRFEVISCLDKDKYAQRLREKNLRHIFGDVFDFVTCIDTGADKDETLLPYKDSGLYWLEDKPENAKLGADLGLNTIMLRHQHNANFSYAGVKVVDNWAQIVNYIN